MADIKKILKENKKKALSIAVAAAFTVTAPINMIGCSNDEFTEDKEQEQTNSSTTTGSGSSYHRNYFRRSGFYSPSLSKNSSKTSSATDNISSDSDSNADSNKSGKSKVKSSKSSGYSKVKGGHFSS